MQRKFPHLVKWVIVAAPLALAACAGFTEADRAALTEARTNSANASAEAARAADMAQQAMNMAQQAQSQAQQAAQAAERAAADAREANERADRMFQQSMRK